MSEPQTEIDTAAYIAAIYEQQAEILKELKHANKVADIMVAQAVQTAKHTRTLSFVAGAFGILMLLGFMSSMMRVFI